MLTFSWFHWNYLSGLLDVILIYTLIYRSLLLVKGTRAEAMLLGLGIVMLVYLASRMLHLATLNWILSNFLNSVILVIVVLFQDDLRRALIKVGLVPGFGQNPKSSLEATLKEISRAAIKLSAAKVGALIVIRREVGLDEYVDAAVKIDGYVSKQLLISIFNPTSPLHDGAVIIQGNRIVAAGAVLPLTKNPTVSKAFGTRHRAAIGLSEVSDSLIVVVSEETGNISLIREGRISRNLDETSLYAALFRLTVYRQQKRFRARKSNVGLENEVDVAGKEILKIPTTGSESIK